MKLKAIVNVNRQWGIGKNGDLLCHIPEDMKFFRETTRDSCLILGRRTLLTFPDAEPLKGRTNIVLTHNASALPESAAAFLHTSPRSDGTSLLCVSTVNAALEQAASLHPSSVFVIGGAEIYSLFLPFCSECLVTRNNCPEKADCFFPDLDLLPDWHCIQSSEPKLYQQLTYQFLVYRRDPFQKNL